MGNNHCDMYNHDVLDIYSIKGLDNIILGGQT